MDKRYFSYSPNKGFQVWKWPGEAWGAACRAVVDIGCENNRELKEEELLISWGEIKEVAQTNKSNLNTSLILKEI